MFIAMNRFRVQGDFAEAFEQRWKERQSYLSEQVGFLRFRLLKTPQPTQDQMEYVSYSEWLDASAFEGWLKGEGSRKAHAQKEPLQGLQGPPEFRGYEVILDEVPGHRTDYRSVAMDLKVEQAMARETPEQVELRRLHAAQNLPPIHIGPFEGRMLEILLRASGARRGIEIGTLGGYSASWIARALPEGGKLLSLEKDPQRARQAAENLKNAGLGAKIEVRAGAAQEMLKSLGAEWGDLDFVFIDADKGAYGEYVEWAIPRLRKGGLLLADNAYIWGGMHYWGRSPDEIPYPPSGLHGYEKSSFKGMSACWNQLAQHPEVASLILPTGEGLGVAVKI